MKQVHKSLTVLHLTGVLDLKIFQKLPIHIYMLRIFTSNQHGRVQKNMT